MADFHKAIEYHEKYLKIAIEIGDLDGKGRASGGLGNAYDSLGDFRKAIEYHENALKIAKEIDDQEGEGVAYGNLGNAFFSLADFRKAIECHEKHLKIAWKSVFLADKERPMEISVMLTTHWLTFRKPLSTTKEPLKLH